MSADFYLGKKAGELRMGKGSGETVLEGGVSAEEARALAARRAAAGRLGEVYKSVADYDPVLRSHCRLDEEE